MAKITRRSLLLLGVGSGLTVLTTALWATPKLLSSNIQAITHKNNHRKQTRVTLTANAPIQYRYFTLANPDRLVIDINGMVKNSALMSLPQKVSASDRFMSRIRLGQKDAQTVRLVFDLKRPTQAHITTKGNQLQIDFSEYNKTIATSATLANANQTTQKNDPLEELLQKHQSRNQQSEATIHTRKRRPVIVLDAGHGGKDPGAIGPKGTYEKNIALTYAHEVRKLLEKKGYTVHMTRNNDTFIPLADRRRKARSVKADLFLSIHANASENKAARGSDVFIWGAKANSERALKLSQAENQADYVDGLPNVGNKNVDMILTDMMRTQTENDSTRLGNQILKRFSQHNELFQSKVGKADFVVLRSLDIPSVLIELAFISNPEEEKKLNNRTFRRNMSAAIADSVEDYLNNAVLSQ